MQRFETFSSNLSLASFYCEMNILINQSINKYSDYNNIFWFESLLNSVNKRVVTDGYP